MTGFSNLTLNSKWSSTADLMITRLFGSYWSLRVFSDYLSIYIMNTATSTNNPPTKGFLRWQFTCHLSTIYSIVFNFKVIRCTKTLTKFRLFPWLLFVQVFSHSSKNAFRKNFIYNWYQIDVSIVVNICCVPFFM